MTNTNSIEIGGTYYSGNTMYPTISTVLGVIPWQTMPDDVRNRPHHNRYDREGVLWVRMRRQGPTPVCYLPLEVFQATHFESAAALPQR